MISWAASKYLLCIFCVRRALNKIIYMAFLIKHSIFSSSFSSSLFCSYIHTYIHTCIRTFLSHTHICTRLDGPIRQPTVRVGLQTNRLHSLVSDVLSLSCSHVCALAGLCRLPDFQHAVHIHRRGKSQRFNTKCRRCVQCEDVRLHSSASIG